MIDKCKYSFQTLGYATSRASTFDLVSLVLLLLLLQLKPTSLPTFTVAVAEVRNEK